MISDPFDLGNQRDIRLINYSDPFDFAEISGNCRKKESEMTLRMMEEYGVDNVRGGNWCSIKLSETPWQLRKDILIDMVESLPDYPG